MNSITNIIEALLLLLGALNSGGLVPPNNHCDIENFLRANGCEELAPGFIVEEIEMRHLPQISDQDLLSLVVQTIGAWCILLLLSGYVGVVDHHVNIRVVGEHYNQKSCVYNVS